MNPIGSPARRQAIAMARDLLDAKPVYLDTETTGLGDNDEIIEIALIDHDGRVLLQSLIRPLGVVPPDATAIHGITGGMLKDAPAWSQIWPQARAALAGRKVAVYNASFDLRLLRQTHRRHRIPWALPEGARFECLMQLYARYRGEWDRLKGAYRWVSLSEAGRQAGLVLANTHRAVDDALMARALLEHLASQRV